MKKIAVSMSYEDSFRLTHKLVFSMLLSGKQCLIITLPR